MTEGWNVMRKHRKLKIALILLASIVILVGIGTTIYVNDYYHAKEEALSALDSNDKVTVSHLDKTTIVFEPEDVEVGFIFYPGGKVQYEAYAPLMQSLAEKGILCILVHMPCNLAVLDVNAADGLKEHYPDIQNWYIGGHSLGGSMAATYVEKHKEDYEGLVLLAAYSTTDLAESGLKVISIYGSEDEVLAIDKYKKYKENLPKNFIEEVINGGCHAYFGTYGEQDGDGTATITGQEQITITTGILVENMRQ